MNEPLYIDRSNPGLVLNTIKVGDWYQLYLEENQNESDIQAYFDGDFWMDGSVDKNNDEVPVCHAHVPFKIVKIS